MKALLGFVLFIAVTSSIGLWYESTIDPYEEGTHFNYSIKCENGFVYKSIGGNKGTIQVFNSDGSPLKCGNKIY